MEPVDRLLRDTLGLEPSSLGTRGADEVVAGRMRALALSDPFHYAALLKSQPEEWQRLVAALMVNETWFFRYPDSFTHLGAFATSIVAAAPTTLVRVLSAPCSTGEEAASAAIALLRAGLEPAQFQIDAIDVSRSALERARAGWYARRAFRDTSPTDLAPWIERVESGYEVAPPVRARITYEEANLLDPGAAVPPPGRRYHAILCRNLQIYLTDAARRALMDKLSDHLLPEGVLYVGHAELGRITRLGFAPLTPMSAFACQPVQATTPAAPPAAPRVAPPRRRIPPPRPAPSAAPASPPVAGLSSHAEARALADRGQTEAARRAIEQAIRFGQADADLYHLQAILAAEDADERYAREALRRALYLDPAHYASLVHAALLAERDGDVGRARRLRDRARRAHGKGEA